MGFSIHAQMQSFSDERGFKLNVSCFLILGGCLRVVLILTLCLASAVIWLPCEYRSAGEVLKAYYCSLPSILWCSSEKIANYVFAY